MAGDSSVAGVIAAASVAGLAPLATPADAHLPPAPALPAPLPAPTAGLRPELSSAARLLSVLVDPALGSTPPPLPPLLPVPTALAPLISQALHDGIARSGLFYESHQADWVAGQRELASIRQEPQAAQAGTTATEDPGIAAIVRQQLEMLDGQPLQWRGELWPGQPLQMSIAKEPRRDSPSAAAAAADEPAWQTTLVSSLPALGRVCARLRFEGDRVWLELGSADAGSARLMTRHADELRAALQSGGLALQSFASRIDDEA